MEILGKLPDWENVWRFRKSEIWKKFGNMQKFRNLEKKFRNLENICKFGKKILKFGEKKFE